MQNWQIRNIVEWAKERGIIQHGDTRAQARKTIEEAAELLEAVTDNDEEQVKDAIGDVLVTIIIQAYMQGLGVGECLNHAYQEIKDRQGEIRDGTFVKEEV